MKKLILTAIIASSLPTMLLASVVASPDGQTVLTTALKDGKPVYTIVYDGRVMIDQSPLGLKSDIADFTGGLTQTDESIEPYSVSFDQSRIKTDKVTFEATRMATSYTTADGKTIVIEWLVGNNDIAFRYLLPRQNTTDSKGRLHKGETGSAVITGEATGFAFPEYTTTFLTPQSDAMIGWKRTKPSYEEIYKPDAPMTDVSQYGHGYTFPCLFRVGDDGWVLVSETGVDGSYCGSHLSDYTDGVYTVAYPMAEENNGNGSAFAGIALPGATPWRTITLGKTLAPVVETVIPWAPLPQLYKAETTEAGRGTWSWIVWQDNSINYDDQVAFIDLAATMGYDHALIDSGWDKTIGRDGMARLARYAQDKCTNIAVWYSSSGWWNDIVQSPTNIMSRPIPRKQELKWLRDLGVKVIKVDFFGGDKQETMRLYEDILSDAADYGISVIFHGCTLPRGWERLYPNYVGSEAVLASENMVFGQDFCDNEAYNAALHPFIRNTVGCMEYGGTFFNDRLSRGNQRGTQRRTSDAFQLAVAVLYQNPVQNFALTPEGLEAVQPASVDFMKAVPTQWSETRFIDGYPGKYAVIARRSGDTWYIAGVSNLDKAVELTLNLPMFAKDQTVTVYNDSDGKPLTATDVKVGKPDKFKIKLAPNHGFVIVSK